MKFPLSIKSGRINEQTPPFRIVCSGEVVFLLKGKGKGGLGPFGICLIILGIMIILALVLPSGFWWLMLGVVMILLGLQLKRY